jgi:hypothetical protein
MEISLEKITEFFLNTEPGKQIQAEEQRQAQRRTLVDKVATLREQEAVELPELRKREQEAAAALENAARVYTAARAAAQDATNQAATL